MANLPKPANKRSRRTTSSGPEFRSVEVAAVEQPSLPDRGVPWSPATQEFWKSLGESELSEDFNGADWLMLRIAAVLHEEIMVDGRTTRVDQFMKIMDRFPFTPKDRQALRIQTLTGDEIERRKTDSRAGAKTSATKARYGELRAVGS